MRRFLNLTCAMLVSALSPLAALATDCVNENTAVAFSTPTSDFTINPDGTATHHKTGLIWDRCALGQSGADCSGGSEVANEWRVVLQYIVSENSNAYKGYSDWRMPNIKEMLSIREWRCFNPHINTTVFPNAPDVAFWSSTAYLAGGSSAWILDAPGQSYVQSKAFNYYSVRMVRGGQLWDAFDAQYPQWLLTVSKSGSGGGTVSDISGPCTLNGDGSCLVDPDSDVTLHAVAAPGSVFVGWSAAAGSVPGSCDGSMDDCGVGAIAANGSVTATFSALILDFGSGFETAFIPAGSVLRPIE